MKLEARISKEKLAKAGLFLAKALLLIVTIRLLFTHDIGAWVIAIFLIASLILVQRKSRFGYSSAKVVVGVLAILPLAGVLNPFTYQDFSGSPAKYAVLVVLAIFSNHRRAIYAVVILTTAQSSPSDHT